MLMLFFLLRFWRAMEGAFLEVTDCPSKPVATAPGKNMIFHYIPSSYWGIPMLINSRMMEVFDGNLLRKLMSNAVLHLASVQTGAVKHSLDDAMNHVAALEKNDCVLPSYSCCLPNSHTNSHALQGTFCSPFCFLSLPLSPFRLFPALGCRFRPLKLAQGCFRRVSMMAFGHASV